MKVRFAPLLFGLFLASAGQNAEAYGCMQGYIVADRIGDFVYGEVNVSFNPNGDGGNYESCAFYAEGGYTYYAPMSFVQLPNGTIASYSYEPNVGGAYSYAYANVAGTGPGIAYVENRVTEYLFMTDYDPDRFDYGPYGVGFEVSGPPGGGDPPTLTLTVSDPAPVVNSGPVTVTADYSGGDPGQVAFSQNCPQATNTTCTFNPTTIGQHTVTGAANGLQAQVNINVVVQQQSGTLRLLLDGDGLDPANAYGTDDRIRFVPGGANFSTTVSDPLPQPRWTVENRQFVDSAKPAISPGAETREFYFVPSSVRKSVCSFVRQLRGPHLSTCA
jgi:hypothetical protein